MDMIFVENEKYITSDIASPTENEGDVQRKNIKLWVAIALVISDLVSLCAAGAISILIRFLFEENVWIRYYVYQVTGLVFLILVFFAVNRLYPGFGIAAEEEFRRIVMTTTIVVFSLAALTFWTRTADLYSRLTFGGTWLFGIIFVPLGRIFTRWLLLKIRLWGEPVIIIGEKDQARYLARYLRRRQNIGFYPVMITDNQDDFYLINDFSLGAMNKTINTAIVINSDITQDYARRMFQKNGQSYNRLILVSNLDRVDSVAVTPLNLGGVLGLEVRDNLMNQFEQTVKRVMDITIVLIGGLLILPFLLLISLLIIIDSRGPVLYSHTRVGKKGVNFEMWKFRSMVSNADEVLERYLKENPDLSREWDSTWKLKDDPRITRMGRLLRRYSLDELPQLWNVLRGDMSLVGPRPIVNEEAARYAESFQFYKKVKPGVTGLWQVSGRNNTTYRERVRLDEYYVRNWSIWLDFYILFQTIRVVLQGEGAY